MYITDINEIVTLLRSKLPEYLALKLGDDFNEYKKFKCFAHDDNDPSMHLNPKTANETVKCFSCGFYGDIFTCAEHFDNLPVNGPEWLKVTIPHLCDELGIDYSIGELTQEDKHRLQLYKVAQDITDILASQKYSQNEYLVSRNWLQGLTPVGTIDADDLIERLINKGWDANFIASTGLIKTRYQTYFGLDKVTFAIKDHCKRTIGFICRNLNYADTGLAKYVNTQETAIYKKNQALLGIDVAYKEAKKFGLFVVEGPGDLMQLYRLGIKNAVAVCGTAFTESHLLYLKTLGIRKIF